VPTARSARTLILRLSLCLILEAPGRAHGEWTERRLASMGTWLDLKVEAPDRSLSLAASEAAVREIARVEALLSTWRPGGPLDRLNAARPGVRVAVGHEAAGLLAQMEGWSARTRGTFEPTVAPLIKAWDLRGRGRVPDDGEIARALAAVGRGVIAVDLQKGEAYRRREGAAVDEGAWGKGYALDRAVAVLKAAGARDAMIDLGGQIISLGKARVSVADPRNRQREAVSVALEASSISTSGDSERFVTVGSRRIGHLLDPRTGQPAADFGSATVIASSALVADVLSTAFFVLGPSRGLDLSRELCNEGFPNEALFLVVAGDRLQVLASPGFHYRSEEVQP
jgi:FAD:protein FMN transferase